MDTHSGVPLGQDLWLPHHTSAGDTLICCIDVYCDVKGYHVSTIHWHVSREHWGDCHPFLVDVASLICSDEKSACGSYKRQDVITSLSGTLAADSAPNQHDMTLPFLFQSKAGTRPCSCSLQTSTLSYIPHTRAPPWESRSGLRAIRSNRGKFISVISRRRRLQLGELNPTTVT